MMNDHCFSLICFVMSVILNHEHKDIWMPRFVGQKTFWFHRQVLAKDKTTFYVSLFFSSFVSHLGKSISHIANVTTAIEIVNAPRETSKRNKEKDIPPCFLFFPLPLFRDANYIPAKKRPLSHSLLRTGPSFVSWTRWVKTNVMWLITDMDIHRSYGILIYEGEKGSHSSMPFCQCDWTVPDEPRNEMYLMSGKKCGDVGNGFHGGGVCLKSGFECVSNAEE